MNEEKHNIAYPFPLRPDCVVMVYAPADMTKEEVKRIAKYIETLSVEEKD